MAESDTPMLVFEQRKKYDEFKRAFQARTKRQALKVGEFCEALPMSRRGRIYGDQLIRSSASVAANYRAACRARSKAEWIAKMGVVEEEADETLFWLEMCAAADLGDGNSTDDLCRESDEILKIVVASIRTSKNSGG